MKIYTIDILSLIIFSVGFFVSLLLSVDMVKLWIMMSVGLLGYVLNLYVLQGRAKLSNDMKNPSVLTYSLFGVFLSVMIQFLVQLPSQFLVSAWEVYAYYAIAGIAEEFFFRYFVITLLEIAFRNLRQPLRTVLIVSVDGLFFMLVHLFVYSSPQSLIIVFLTGITYAILFMYTKSMLPTLIAHVVVNMIASSFIVQSLSSLTGVWT